MAATICTPYLPGCVELPLKDYGPGDLGRAMTICMQHERPTGIVYPEGGRPRDWDDAWKACYRVNTEWQQSEVARQQREYEAKVEADRQWIEEYVKGLGDKR